MTGLKEGYAMWHTIPLYYVLGMRYGLTLEGIGILEKIGACDMFEVCFYTKSSMQCNETLLKAAARDSGLVWIDGFKRKRRFVNVRHKEEDRVALQRRWETVTLEDIVAASPAFPKVLSSILVYALDNNPDLIWGSSLGFYINSLFK